MTRHRRVHLPIEEKLAMAETLYANAKALHPGWPSDDERWEDLQHHLRVKALLARAAHVGRRD
ncbi:MAG: hypothetical protein AAF938_23070 [Myxococcota bacterium]